MAPDDLDIGRPQRPPPRRGSPWKYFAAGFLTCLFLDAVLQLTGVVLGIAALLTSVLFPLLCVAVLGWFGYWLLLSRRGIIGRRLHYRRMEARRHARWMRRAAERGRDN